LRERGWFASLTVRIALFALLMTGCANEPPRAPLPEPNRNQ